MGSPCGACGQEPLLDGRFRFDAEIGRGATGVTWRATDLQHGTTVAVKAQPLASDGKAGQLEERELRVLREVDHPQLPRLLAVLHRGVGHGRVRYLVQTHLDGETLAALLQRRRFTAREVARILRSALAPLTWLHERSPPIVHRDVKPGNLILRPDGAVALVDFGAVRDALKGTLGGSTVAGTFGYMAPEQFRGDAEPATDLYGLGATGIHLVTRREPHGLLDLKQRFAWRPWADLPEALSSLLDALTAPSPADRPRGDEVARRLDAFLAGQDGPDAPSVRASPRPLGRTPAAPAVPRPARPALAYAEPPVPPDPVGFDEPLVARERPSSPGRSAGLLGAGVGAAALFLCGAMVSALGVGLAVLEKQPSPPPPPTRVAAVAAPPEARPAPPAPSEPVVSDAVGPGGALPARTEALLATDPAAMDCLDEGESRLAYAVVGPDGIALAPSRGRTRGRADLGACLARAPFALELPPDHYGFSTHIHDLRLADGERVVARQSGGLAPRGDLTVRLPLDPALDVVVFQDSHALRVRGGGDVTVPVQRSLTGVHVFRFGETDPSAVRSFSIRDGSCVWDWDRPDVLPVCVPVEPPR